MTYNLFKEKCAPQTCLNALVPHFTSLHPLIGYLTTPVPQLSGLIGHPALWGVGQGSEPGPDASSTGWEGRNVHTWILL